MIFEDYPALDNCKNIEQSFGEICVKCNKCGRFELPKAPIPEGYVEIDKEFCADKIKQVGLDIKAVNGVFASENEMVITGTPDEDDETHNCDELGCSSVNHVLYRQSI